MEPPPTNHPAARVCVRFGVSTDRTLEASHARPFLVVTPSSGSTCAIARSDLSASRIPQIRSSNGSGKAVGFPR